MWKIFTYFVQIKTSIKNGEKQLKSYFIFEVVSYDCSIIFKLRSTISNPRDMTLVNAILKRKLTVKKLSTHFEPPRSKEL